VLALVWLPAALCALGVPLTSWTVAAGYLGISWLLPGVLVRAAVRDCTHDLGVAHYRAAGLAAGAIAALGFLLAAAAAIGT
jgi:hypothetical protein